jgi:hypothetical protein
MASGPVAGFGWGAMRRPSETPQQTASGISASGGSSKLEHR